MCQNDVHVLFHVKRRAFLSQAHVLKRKCRAEPVTGVRAERCSAKPPHPQPKACMREISVFFVEKRAFLAQTRSFRAVLRGGISTQDRIFQRTRSRTPWRRRQKQTTEILACGRRTLCAHPPTGIASLPVARLSLSPDSHAAEATGAACPSGWLFAA